MIIDIGEMLFQLFGNGYVFALFIIGTITLIYLSIKANTPTLLIALFPLIVGFALNNRVTQMIIMQAWILYIFIGIMGFVFAIWFFHELLSR